MRRMAALSLALMCLAGCGDGTGIPAAKTSSAERGPATLEAVRPSTPSDLDAEKAPKDEEVTASIRNQLMDTAMAVNVESLNIVTNDGYVTLCGTVKTPEEKQKVESVAQTVAGADKIYSHIEVE